MIWQFIGQDPFFFLFWLVSVVVALTIHEFSHALVAFWCGDHTAQREGRLSLNPIVHIDPWGAFLLLVAGFGWAKPVPFSPYHLRSPKRDSILIALAGPASNFLLAAVAACSIRLLGTVQPSLLSTGLGIFLLFFVIINLSLALFNLLPVPPLDGSKLLLVLLDQPHHVRWRECVVTQGPWVLMGLVLISVFTPLNPFFWLSEGVFFVCRQLVGFTCLG